MFYRMQAIRLHINKFQNKKWSIRLCYIYFSPARWLKIITSYVN